MSTSVWLRRHVFELTVTVAAFSFPLSALAQAQDELWEVTMKMEMPGMPMTMPAQVHRVCVAKNHKDEDLIPKRDNCKVLESNKSGNKLSYKIACTGEEASTASGEITYAGNSYDGRMQITTKSGGDSVSMQQSFAGKRVGDCTATK